MAGVAGEHRAAARLRHVAHQKARPARDLRHLLGKPLHERDELGVAEIALAREPHHLPGLAVDRQRDAAGEAAAGVEADRARFEFRGLELAGEQFPGGVLRIVRIGERRQRFGVDGALVLSARRDRGGQRG